MRLCRHTIVGDIDNVLVVDLPSWLLVTSSYRGKDLVLTIAPQPAFPSFERPTKSSQSPGVDIDRIHLKYAGEHHVQQPRPKD